MKQCPCCDACYAKLAGHLQSRFRKHTKNTGPMKSHLQQCKANLEEQDVPREGKHLFGSGSLTQPLTRKTNTGAGDWQLSCSRHPADHLTFVYS